ncbi:hypothetical protein J4213_00470 [Candidatus Woesearchaeota archaeon]|nr:hypothetical protein [Candidatus Woesearchaeota archaeon]
MTPKQALMWFVVVLVVVGILYAIISYSITKSTDVALVGVVIAVIGIVLALISKKIRWS